MAYIEKLRKFFISRQFMLVAAFIGAVFVSFGKEVEGAIFFAILISLILVVCEDIMATTLPFLIVCISVLQCYDSFDAFIKYIWLAVIPVGAVLFHFIYYRKKIVIGKTFWGILAVSVAVTLGGIGSISLKEYFGGSSLYYIAGLGVGMAITYILIKSQMNIERDYDLREKFVDIMYIAGLFACFEIAEIYVENFANLHTAENFAPLHKEGIFCIFDGGEGKNCLQRFFEVRDNIGGWDGALPGANVSQNYPLGTSMLQPGNNISTFLMLFLPFPFYRAMKGNKHLYHLLSAFLMLGVLYLSGSRGGLYLGAVEFVICLAAFAFMAKSKISKAVGFGLLGAVLAAGALLAVKLGVIDKIGGLWESLKETLAGTAAEGEPVQDAKSAESRVRLIKRSVEDFKSSPIFGKGIGQKPADFPYAGKEGTMKWYHMMIPQVIGSMGIVGIIAYGYQFFGRVREIFKKFSPYVMTLGLSYMGMLLMSQVNPGEFCPLPYQLMVVMLFIIIENEPDRQKGLKNKI